jgi:exosome complex component CSL4
MAEREGRPGNFVVPGERIAVIEEFNPSLGTFEENGNIRSEIAGFVVVDSVSRTISVLRRGNRPKIPRRGAIIIGQISTAESKFANINIFKVGNDLVEKPFEGLLHITRIGRGYVKQLEDVIKSGDLIKGRVVSNKNGVCQVATIGDIFGVIQAYCSSCGTRLTLVGRGRLVCPNCGKTETRKTAEDYGLPQR